VLNDWTDVEEADSGFGPVGDSAYDVSEFLCIHGIRKVKDGAAISTLFIPRNETCQKSNFCRDEISARSGADALCEIFAERKKEFDRNAEELLFQKGLLIRQ
jgi:hypothetical protein